jgi:hypothetical protein
VFGKALQCISKLGDDLFIEAYRDQLVLRTVNSSRSAYACYLFKEGFFHEFLAPTLPWAPAAGAATQGSQPATNATESEPIRCKASSKSCSGVFRSLGSIEKTVDQCLVKLDEAESRLIFKLKCKHGALALALRACKWGKGCWRRTPACLC